MSKLHEKKLAIWGWWQGENFGDQWIKEIMSNIFPNAIFIDTTEVQLNKFDFVVGGGGGLFINGIPKSWSRIKKPHGIIGIGAEFKHTSDAAKKLASTSAFFFVRDIYSSECMGLKNYPRSFDISFKSPLPIRDEIVSMENCLLIWRTPNENMLRDEKFSLYQRAKYDYYDWESIIKKRFKKVDIIDFSTYNKHVIEKLKNASFIISGRYHGIIAAIQQGIPCLAIDICPKIRSLMKEVGLERYCLKLDEFNKLDILIEDILSNSSSMRKAQLKFREIAVKTITEQVEFAKFQVIKSLYPIKIIHYGNYHFGETDVVKAMADSLIKAAPKATSIEVKKGMFTRLFRVKSILPTPNGDITVLRISALFLDILRKRADAIILNSGGLIIEPIGFRILHKFGKKIFGIELSDPDVYKYNGEIYAKNFDRYYTNALYSKENQYEFDVGLMGFAASTDKHYYMPDVEKKYDVVIVGGCRPDREAVVNELKKHFNVGLYGLGWKSSNGFVSGKKLVHAINSGKIYISFSKTRAGYNNVKVGLFEAIACKSCVFTEYMDELSLYFDIGKEIVCYNGIVDLINKIKYYLEHEYERVEIAERGYQRFLNEHTYEKRWDIVLKDMYKIKGIF